MSDILVGNICPACNCEYGVDPCTHQKPPLVGKVEDNIEIIEDVEPVKRGRGRPKGENNKTDDMKAYKKEYNKKYYQENKEKFYKSTGKKSGQRGKGKKLKYKLSILGEGDQVLIEQNYTSQKAIADALKMKEYTVS